MKIDGRSHRQVKDTETVLGYLAKLPVEQKCAFGASCSERLYPVYEAFCVRMGADAGPLRQAIDDLWDAVLQKHPVVRRHSEDDLFALGPSSVHHHGAFVFGAQFAVSCVLHAWSAFSTPDSDEAVWCSVVSRDAISDYLEWVSAPRYGNDLPAVPPAPEPAIDWYGHPLMQHEMKKQFADLELLASPVRLDEQIAWQLRCGGARGIAPLGRGLYLRR